MSPEGEPIEPPSICVYMTPLKLNSTEIVANFISLTKGILWNKRRGQHGISNIPIVSVRGTQVKRLEILKEHFKFISWQVILYKIREFKRIFDTGWIVLFPNWLWYSGKPLGHTMLRRPYHGQKRSQWDPNFVFWVNNRDETNRTRGSSHIRNASRQNPTFNPLD